MPELVLTVQGKADVLTEYATRYPRRVLIETGLCDGMGTGMRIDRVALGIERYIVLDIDPDQCLQAHAATLTMAGDSGLNMPNALALVDMPAIFWLDAHFNTEAGDVQQERMCPLLDELTAIRAWPHAAVSVVLIDDVRLFGQPGWPSDEEITALLWPMWFAEDEDDILRLTPR